ncbi:MAG TPA: ABC-2 family transporter protein [Anaerolineales bacterium]|nr:ABC-2 family transporter protein [Anaerolineales bacterium]
MLALLDLYKAQFRTSLATMFQYRASLVIWLISQVLDPVIYLIVWSTVAVASGGSVAGYTTGDFAAYFIVLMLVNHLTYTWIMWEYEYRVREGTLSAVLLRPVHPIHSDIADNLSSKAVSTPGILLAAVLLGMLFHPTFHLVGWALVAFLPAVALAFLLRFLVEWTLALAAFWTTRVSALNQAYFVAMLFLSGQVAPLALFPPAVQTLASLLPFRWMISFPVELFLGTLTPRQAATGFAAQAAWIILGLIALRLTWRAGVRVYSAVSG